VAVCRKHYIHPLVLASYLDGTLAAKCKRGSQAEAVLVNLLKAAN